MKKIIFLLISILCHEAVQGKNFLGQRLFCIPDEYKMFDGVVFNQNNLTNEDLKSISFQIKIDSSSKTLEWKTSTGNKKTFEIDDISESFVRASGVWSGQNYEIFLDHQFHYQVKIAFEDLLSFDNGKCVKSEMSVDKK